MNRLDELKEHFEAYDQKYPEFWRMFQEFTFQMIRRGKKNYSVNAIFERIRWEKDVGGDGILEFKINNNHRPFYSRKFIEAYPQYKNFFRTRKQTSKYKVATYLPELTPEDV